MTEQSRGRLCLILSDYAHCMPCVSQARRRCIFTYFNTGSDAFHNDSQDVWFHFCLEWFKEFGANVVPHFSHIVITLDGIVLNKNQGKIADNAYKCHERRPSQKHEKQKLNEYTAIINTIASWRITEILEIGQLDWELRPVQPYPVFNRF